jgi:DNA end-binding protein Ku
MAARAMWKGNLRIDGISVPVRMFSAVEDKGIHFRLLHERDRVPVKQHMVHSGTGDVVPSDRIRRGYEVEPGLFVILNDDELAELEPEPDRDIEILSFVERERVSSAWYDRPYWLGPDGSNDDYFAFSAALESEGRIGIARWTMRKQRYIGALSQQGPWLVLSTLRHLGEVVPRSELGAAPKASIDAAEAKLAQQLVSVLEDDLDLSAYHDEHRERVMQLIEAKAAGKRPRLSKPKRKRETVSLAESLARSIASAKKEKRVA